MTCFIPFLRDSDPCYACYEPAVLYYVLHARLCSSFVGPDAFLT